MHVHAQLHQAITAAVHELSCVGIEPTVCRYRGQ